MIKGDGPCPAAGTCGRCCTGIGCCGRCGVAGGTGKCWATGCAVGSGAGTGAGIEAGAEAVASGLANGEASAWCAQGTRSAWASGLVAGSEGSMAGGALGSVNKLVNTPALEFPAGAEVWALALGWKTLGRNSFGVSSTEMDSWKLPAGCRRFRQNVWQCMQ